MIPVHMQPEPADFAKKVRNPGQKFLKQTPAPNTEQWKRNDYWRKALFDMRNSYNKICAYCAFWIPHSTGAQSIDHFIPKSIDPDLAYEWSNFRYVSARFNSRKGTRKIIDPFSLKPDSFILDFSSFFIKANPLLSVIIKEQIEETIKILKLNDDEDLITERQNWYFAYQKKEITYRHLEKKAPFIAYEIKRQSKNFPKSGGD
jgi:uncharacterized protein (TIGR02646 family)